MPKRRIRRFLALGRSRPFSRPRKRRRLTATRRGEVSERTEDSCVCPPRNPRIVTETPLELKFTGPQDLFLSLIHPVTEEEFFTEYWESKPLLISRGGGNIPLFTLNTLRELAKSEEEPLLFGRHVNVCRYKNGSRRSYGEPGEVLSSNHLDYLWKKKTATFQFLQPQQFQDKLWHILSLLESYFNCLVGSNVYITPGESQGLAPHYDDVEVFIVQIEGTKRWRLYPPCFPLPLSSSPDLRTQDIGSPSHDIVLNVGDVLYFPRGTIHQAFTPSSSSSSSSSHSTHITISTYQQNTWGDLLSNAFSSAIRQLMEMKMDYRKGIPLQLLSQAILTKSEVDQSNRGARDQLLNMGRSVLQHMSSHHLSLTKKSRLTFISTRLPPFTSQPPPYGPAPTIDSMVELLWPDHILVVLSGSESVVVEEETETSERKKKKRVKFEEEEEEREKEEEEEEAVEVIVYHSMANDRSSHMVAGEEETHGVRLPGHCLPTLSLLSSASSPLPASSLPLTPEDTLSCLFPLWVEGLLQVT